jgi:hypothetical protein
MRTLIHLALAATICTAASADPASSASSITTLSGKSYQNCRVLKTEPDGITFRHSRGIAKVLYSQMSEGVRDDLGYDAKKEEKYEKDLAAKRERIRKEKAERAKEIAKAQKAANEAAFQRNTLMMIASIAGANQAAQFQQSYPHLVPAVGLYNGIYGLPGMVSYPGYGAGIQNCGYPTDGRYGYLLNGGPNINWCNTGLVCHRDIEPGDGRHGYLSHSQHPWHGHGSHGGRPYAGDLDLHTRIVHRQVIPCISHYQVTPNIPLGVPALGASPVHSLGATVPAVRGSVSVPAHHH